VAACGVCRTDLHVVDGELADPHVPIIPGHEIVAGSTRSGLGSMGYTWASASAFPGLAIPVAYALIALATREPV